MTTLNSKVLNAIFSIIVGGIAGGTITSSWLGVMVGGLIGWIACDIPGLRIAIQRAYHIARGWKPNTAYWSAHWYQIRLFFTSWYWSTVSFGLLLWWLTNFLVACTVLSVGLLHSNRPHDWKDISFGYGFITMFWFVGASLLSLFQCLIVLLDDQPHLKRRTAQFRRLARQLYPTTVLFRQLPRWMNQAWQSVYRTAKAWPSIVVGSMVITFLSIQASVDFVRFCRRFGKRFFIEIHEQKNMRLLCGAETALTGLIARAATMHGMNFVLVAIVVGFALGLISFVFVPWLKRNGQLPAHV